MKIKLKKYTEQLETWPKTGHHIMAQYDNEKVIVYQSYRPEIGHFAATNQYFGGAFSLDRMTWIKPNFLWMMYRNGWGQKEGQEVTLAIHLKLDAFEAYLKQSVYSTFDNSRYESNEVWKKAVNSSSSRLQWDPDHNPHGHKLERRAIQIGLRNDLTRSYSKEDIIEIEDVSSFVAEQFEFVKANQLDKLATPEEHPLLFEDQKLNEHLKLEHHESSSNKEN